MAIQSVPTFLQNASHSAAIFRQSASAAFAGGGVLSPGELALTQQGTPNMSVVLGAGRAKVVGNSVSPPSGFAWTTQAMYDILNDAALSLTVTASNATNPRIDAAYVQVQDAFYSGATNTAVPGVVAGVPAASPSAPAVPINSLLIGYIAVGANVTSITAGNITQQAVIRAEIAGVQVHSYRFNNVGARNAQTGMIQGDIGNQLDTGANYKYDGFNWKNQTSGLVPITPSGVTGGTLSGGTVNFTAANPITVLNVFSAEFEFYRIVIRYAKSASGNLFLQLANGGVTNSANYNYQNNIDIGTTATVPITGSGSSSAQIDQGAVVTASTFMTLEIADPFLAAPTFGLIQFTSINSTAFTARGSWNHNVASSFTDLSLYPGAGSLAGTLHVYGFNLV